MNAPGPKPRLAADYFDGSSARAHRVTAWVDEDQLHWAGEGAPASSVPKRSAVWPERQRHGQRHVQLPDGGVLVFVDASAFDAWAAAAGQGDGAVVRWQQSWRLTSLAVVLFVACLLAFWRWGIPAAANVAVAWLPEAVDVEIGQRSLAYIDGRWLAPSRLDAEVQADVQARFAAALDAARPALGLQPAHRILFRDGGKLGPNAFALPGGDIVVTDALVKLLQDEPQALVGVIAHELGHVKLRHGMRQATQAAGLGLIAGLVLGDFSFLLASAPALLAQMDYSRDFEREADVNARDLLRAAGIDPRVMVVFFERVEKEAGADERPLLPIALSSHPATGERIRFFSQR